VIVGILTASRSRSRCLASLAAAAAAAAAGAPYGFKLQFAVAHDPVVLAIPEMCAVLLAVGTLHLTRPRLWILERFGTTARRWVSAAVAAAAVICGPQLVLGAAAAAGTPPGTWSHTATSMLFLAGIAVLAAPWLGTVRAAGLILLAYLVLTVAGQLSPVVLEWSPLATVNWPEAAPVPSGRVVVAGMTAAAALMVAVRTLGLSSATWKSG
jgi:hypothetical protein